MTTTRSTVLALLGWLVLGCGGGSGGTDPEPPAQEPAPTLTSLRGNAQDGVVGRRLTQPVAVLARRASGVALPGASISWTPSADGTVSEEVTATDGDGVAEVVWTLGAGEGQQTLTAELSGANGSPVTFTATAAAPPEGQVVISGISPLPMIEGAAATISGTGFGSSAAGLSVEIDGVAAPVTQVSPTAIQVTVPASDCKPARPAGVSVTVGDVESDQFAGSVAPEAFVSVPVGQQVLLQDPAAFCLQFDGGSGDREFLVGVQSTSEVVSNLTTVSVTATASGDGVAPLPSLAVRRLGGASPAAGSFRPGTRRLDRLARHRQAEADIQRMGKAVAERLRGRAGGLASFATTARSMAAAVDDTVGLNVPNFAGGDPCTAIPVTAVVRAVGQRAIWLEDVDNPADGYAPGDFDALSAQLDDLTYDADVEHFGDPTDLDGSGGILVLITKETNRIGGALGFVSSTDFFSQASCPASNQGEIFYGAAPDAAGTYALGPYPAEQARADAPFVFAHEFTHIIQTGRRLYVAQGPLMAAWTAEGQATLAEEIVGFADEGHQPGQNLGAEVALNQDDPASTDWYQDRFIDLAVYYGYQGTATQVAGAPAECSWLDKAPANPDPCLNGREIYGVPWSLLRWIADRYGPTYPGGEAGLQQAIINSTAVGYANLEDVVGVPIRTLLARWAAALYVDDRIQGASADLTVSTWDLYDVFDVHVVPSARLTPVSRGFGSFSETAAVRAGSTAYFRLSGADGPATALKVRSGGGTALPAQMQVFVVRLR
ncbi:MAG TPA: IPT/TIG domain-containing protein [Gemmatimonadales bacterium]|nr:IPT/TIG domain-containing protein [Gemmatimonadales bacterium]